MKLALRHGQRIAIGLGVTLLLWLMASCSRQDVVRLCVETNPGAVLLMRIDGHVASMEGLEGQFVAGDTIAYRIVNQDITIRGDIQAVVLPDPTQQGMAANVVELDVRQCPQLVRLVCNTHRLASVDLTSSASLEVLVLPNNVLTQVDVSHCLRLRTLDLEGNPIGDIDLSHNPLLELLWMSRCSLRSLRVEQCPALKGLQCSQNRIAELDLSANRRLRGLVCAGNLLSQLILPGQDSLTVLSCSFNSLRGLDVSHCPALRELWCQGNQLGDSAMIALVESLPMVPDRSGRLVPVDSDLPTEGNVSTPTTESLARLKGWEVFEVFDARATSQGHLPQ